MKGGEVSSGNKLKENTNIGLDEGNDSEEEAAMDSPTKPSKFEAIQPFKDLYPSSDIVKVMREFGVNIVPLQVIGMMLNYIGNHLL